MVPRSAARGLLPAALLAAALAVAPAPARSAGPVPELPAYTDTLEVEPGAQVICLHRAFVLRESVELTEDGRPLEPGRDYFLDADAGCLTLNAAGTLGRRIVARYQAVPQDILGAYRLREDPHLRRLAAASPADTAAAPVRPFNPAEETEGLDLSGSKTFAVEIGNRQDLKLRQSLDLRLAGRVTRDVTLLAILSDQDLPFQPQGNTAELEELDRVLVQVQSPKAGASLGDVSLGIHGFSFLDLSREMEGFTGEAKLAAGSAEGAVASAKGEYVSTQLFGTDGKQGPYLLADRTDSSGVVVVAGSETVWLDGDLLQRGRENDYVIDYSLGEITFTSRRVITANSEITVDYQVASSRYRRRLSYAGVQSAPLGTLGALKAAVYSEGDDPDNPFGGALTASERAELAALGDSARVGGGTRYVGPGNGDYELVVDAASGREVFVYVEGAGDYTVVFVDVGEDKGEYAPDPEVSAAKTVYRYVGPGNGSYVPRRDLPPPERRRVADLRWDLRGRGGTVSVEGALSEADGNTLSPIGDGDNQGGALLAEGTFRPLAVGGNLTVAPSFRVRRVGADFRSPGRLYPAFYTREWNLTGLEQLRDENLQEGAVEVLWKDRLRLRSEAGRLAAADTFRAVRQRQVLSWNDAWVSAQGAWSTTRNDVEAAHGRLDRTDGALRLQRGRVQPRVSAFHEVRRRALGGGERHRGWEGALLFPPEAWPVRAELGVSRRLDDSLRVDDGAWTPAQTATGAFGTVSGTAANLDFLLRYEARRVETPGSGSERRDLGRIDLRHRAVRGAWTAVLSADVGTEGVRRRSKSIVPAATDSTGYFDRFGNYVGPGGGYDVEYGPRGEEVLTGKVDLTTRLRWSPPGQDLPGPAWLGKLAWEGFVTLSEASSLPLTTPRYFLDPGSYLNRRTTLDGRLNERQILDLFPLHRAAGMRFRQETVRSVIQSPSAGEGGTLAELRTQNDYVATLRTNPAPGWDAELEGSVGTRREEVDLGGGDGFVQATDLHGATARGGRRVAAVGGNGRLSAEVTWSRERGEGRDAVAWVVRPRLEWTRSGVGRLDVRYALTDFVRRTGFTGYRGPGSTALTQGWRLDTVAELRLREGVTLTTALVLDHPTGLATVRQGRVEVRGTF